MQDFRVEKMPVLLEDITSSYTYGLVQVFHYG